MITIIGYAYEADQHCQECAEKRFGMELYSICPVKDNKGNDVHAMFSHEEHDLLHCGDCNKELA